MQTLQLQTTHVMTSTENSKIGYLLGFLVAAILLCAAAERLIASGFIGPISAETRASVLSALK